MRKFLVLLLAFLGLSSAAAAAGKPVILVLGDSLSAGYGTPVDQSWVARLQHRLEHQSFPSAILRPGQVFRSLTVHKFSAK